MAALALDAGGFLEDAAEPGALTAEQVAVLFMEMAGVVDATAADRLQKETS